MSPSTGTFISMDSYAGSLSDPVTLHKYLYANANPVMNSDPSGFMSISELATRMGIDISQKSSEAIRNAILVRTLKRALAGAVAGAVFGGVDSYLSGNSMSTVFKDAFIGSLCGFGIGALLYVAMIYAEVSVPVYITLHIFKYGILLAGGLGVPIALDEGNGKLALFRAITTLVGYIGFSKALSGIKCEPLIKGGSCPIPLSKKAILKKNQLPIKGKIRFVPDKKWTPSQPLKKQNGGYIDRFGNVWTKGPSRTAGEAFEWDVQLSKKGIEQVGWLSRDNAHINVSLEGEITHRLEK